MHKTQLEGILCPLNEKEIGYRDENKGPVYVESNIFFRGGTPCYQMPDERSTDLPFSFQFHPHIVISRHVRYAPVKKHTHEWIELCYMYSGSCTQVINDTIPVTLKKGQMLILDSGAYHSIGNTEENDVLINIQMNKAYFTEAFFKHFSQENILLRFLLNAISEKTAYDNFILFESEESHRIDAFMKELIAEFLAPPSENSVDVVDNLLNLIFLELVSVYRQQKFTSEMRMKKANIVMILQYIEKNFNTCTLDSTAEFFNMNPNYLSTLLKKNAGYSFKELIQHYRFIYVTTMLSNTQIPVDEIILQAGYEYTSYFYKKFKEKYSCSPTEFRRRMKEFT